MAIQKDLDMTKAIMHDTIEAALERGVKLDELIEKSDDLSVCSICCKHSASQSEKCGNHPWFRGISIGEEWWLMYFLWVVVAARRARRCFTRRPRSTINAVTSCDDEIEKKRKGEREGTNKRAFFRRSAGSENDMAQVM